VQARNHLDSPELAPPREFDDYVVIRQLGRGAGGQVFLAEDTVLARHVAIKFLTVEADPAARQRFLVEARAAARVQHPNVASVFRVGELGDRPYIVGELVGGSSLAQLSRPMEWTRVLAIAVQIARGLAAAHRSGVLHCDVKPANVMVGDDGVAKLVDFGLAQIVRGRAGAATLMSGTPDYMAPEIWAGEPPSRRSDVYSLGAVLYELVSGAPPLAKLPVAELANASRQAEVLPLETDPRLATIVMRCLGRDPELRFAGGEELREALEQLDAARTQPTNAGENPYRGLRPFEAAHRGVFFGRGIEVAALIDRLRSSSLVVVAGDSGVGKSSLVRAGVLPALADGALDPERSWRTITIVPGRRPLLALERALDDAGLAERLLDSPDLLARELHRRCGRGSGFVIFVDQLEEIVTVADPLEAAAFDAALARISEGNSAVKLIATVRADFLPRIVGLPKLGQELARLLYFVRMLPPERIRDVITGPATATHVTFESDQMIAELAEATARAGSGGLPLLSFALAELWEAHDRDLHVITRATLDAVGGVAGALARHADMILAALTPRQREEARHVLLRLVSALGTRVRRTRDELALGDGSGVALDALVKGRLLVALDGDGGTSYEIAHEVLVGGWGTLREWLDADSRQRASRERLAVACAEWERIGRRRDATLRGARLAEAVALDRDALLPAERALIAASIHAERRTSWLKRVAIIAAVALALASYGTQRYLASRANARRVAAALGVASDELAAGRAADSRSRDLATRAFGAFDRGDGSGAATSTAGEALWSTARETQLLAARSYRSATRAVEAALAIDPWRADARDLLGDTLIERALLAEHMHDDEIRDEVLGRLPSYDADGTRRDRWSRGGSATVHAMVGAVISIDGVVVGDATVALAAGLHAADVDALGRVHVHEPFVVERDRSVELTLIPPPIASVPAGYVYVPPGRFLYGSSADEDARKTFYATAPLHERTTAAFVIGRDEVTFGDWLAYVEAQPVAQRTSLLPNLPIQAGPGIVISPTHRGWQLALQPLATLYRAAAGEHVRYSGRTQRLDQDWRRFPVIGVSAADAEKYAAWLAQTGRVANARLCSEVEWERAARGADGRDYPAGHPLAPDDANIDETYGHDLMGPDEVGSHPTSVSPYGLADMCGNAFELTRAEHGDGYVGRGGGYAYDRKQANLANRAVLARDYREVTLGFRVCATPIIPGDR
jgi:formylglycine-generating enzyme required for sulfatase activity